MPRAVKIGTVNAASPTPLTPQGELDEPSVHALVEHWVGLQLDGAMVLGTMGEGMLLSDATRNAWVEASVGAVDHRLTVFATAADLSRQRMRERALRYANLGADCIVLCLPVKVPAPRAIADVKAVAEACPIPCAYYDIPANTGTPLVLQEVLDILSHENIIAMKDSSGNALLAEALTSDQFRPPGVKVLHGNEYSTAYSAAMGYDGVLHGGGALTGRRVRMVWDAVLAGHWDEALTLHRQTSLFLGTVYNRFSRPLQNVAGQKHALKLLGALGSDAAIEQMLDDAARDRVAKAVEELRPTLVGAAAGV